MKPLFFNFPDDQSTYPINDEWLLGDSLLVAPMLTDARAAPFTYQRASGMT